MCENAVAIDSSRRILVKGAELRSRNSAPQALVMNGEVARHATLAIQPLQISGFPNGEPRSSARYSAVKVLAEIRQHGEKNRVLLFPLQ